MKRGFPPSLLVLPLLLLPGSALSIPQLEVYSFSGEIVGGDNPGYVVNSTVTFSWDDACNGAGPAFCDLTVTLRADPSGSGPIPSQGEVLAGIAFDVLGGADFRDGPPGNMPWDGATAGAEALIGSGAASAALELGTLLSGLIDVSGHWGLNPAINVPGQGSLFLGSVGDIFNGAATLGSGQLFSANMSILELDSPDGSLFGIVDSGSTVGGSGFPTGDLAYIQDEVTVILKYEGVLTGVDNVEPLYGTMGLPIPEPATGALLALGLAFLARARRS